MHYLSIHPCKKIICTIANLSQKNTHYICSSAVIRDMNWYTRYDTKITFKYETIKIDKSTYAFALLFFSPRTQCSIKYMEN